MYLARCVTSGRSGRLGEMRGDPIENISLTDLIALNKGLQRRSHGHPGPRKCVVILTVRYQPINVMFHVFDICRDCSSQPFTVTTILASKCSWRWNLGVKWHNPNLKKLRNEKIVNTAEKIVITADNSFAIKTLPHDVLTIHTVGLWVLPTSWAAGPSSSQYECVGVSGFSKHDCLHLICHISSEMVDYVKLVILVSIIFSPWLACSTIISPFWRFKSISAIPSQYSSVSLT